MDNETLQFVLTVRVIRLCLSGVRHVVVVGIAVVAQNNLMANHAVFIGDVIVDRRENAIWRMRQAARARHSKSTIKHDDSMSVPLEEHCNSHIIRDRAAEQAIVRSAESVAAPVLSSNAINITAGCD